MPLSIPLPAKAKVIINGAVIENSGAANITLTIHNKANILRDKDVLTGEEANSPAKEVYHSIQNAYLFEGNKDEWLSIARSLLSGYVAAWPDAEPIVGHVTDLLNEDKLYNALRASRRLIAFESGDPGAAVGSVAAAAAERARPEQPERSPVRAQEITRIKSQIAELERRIATLDGD